MLKTEIIYLCFCYYVTMPKIHFYPEWDNHDLMNAAEKYQAIWDNEAENIIKIISDITGLHFIENEINAIVFEGRSYSHPLQLRASYPTKVKKAALVHELCHRIAKGNKLRLENDEDPKLLSAHKVIFLVLYDILVVLYGEDLAEYNKELESGYSEEYKQAWEWALSFNKEERQDRFQQLIP